MFILNAIGSFLLDHWIITLCVLMAIGVAIRVFYYASNPVAVITDVIEYTRKHWKMMLTGVVIAIPLFYVWKLNHTITEQQITITKQQATIAQDIIDIKILTDNAVTLQSAIADANAMVEKFDKFSNDTKITFNKINQNVVNQNNELRQQLQNILHEKTPLTCEESIQYLITANKGYAK